MTSPTVLRPSDYARLLEVVEELVDERPDRPEEFGDVIVRADTSEAAERLASVVTQEQADLLLSYDQAGGYGHRDHVALHRVGRRAASLTGVRLLEATIPREWAVWTVRLLKVPRLLVRHDANAARAWGTPRSQITHRVHVRRFAARKRDALAAHKSQIGLGSGRGSRAFWLLVHVPSPVFGLLLSREWFIEPWPGGAADLPSAFRAAGHPSAR